MNNELEAVKNDMIRLVEDARVLLSATGDLAEDKVLEARARLAAALEIGKKFGCRVGEKAVESAKSADFAVREHPYQALGLALGLGAILGFFLARRN